MRTGKSRSKHSSPKMTTMQSNLGGQRALLPERGSFDMWHDYMNLCNLLGNLHSSVTDASRRDTEEPTRDPTAAPWRPIQASRMRKNVKRSSESSSLSDSSCNGTSSSFSSSSSSSSSDCCRFCKQNGESARVYRSHKLKSDDGKVTCPILWSYTCPICEATGDNAHTRKYCPEEQRQKEAREMQPGWRSW